MIWAAQRRIRACGNPAPVVFYPRHFAYLGLAAVGEFVALRLLNRWQPPFLDRFAAYFVLNGLPHGAALVMAIRAQGSWPRRVVFVAITAALSMAAYYPGILLEEIILPAAVYQFIGLAFPSALGAAMYWCLVRLFWIRDLTALSLLRTVALCAAVTVIWEKSNHFAWLPDSLHLMMHTLCWWLAFSFSLYVFECVGGIRAGETGP